MQIEESIWKKISIYFHFVDDLDPLLKCDICKGIMRDPIDSTCGHKFCLKCFNDIPNSAYIIVNFFKKTTICPIDSANISSTNTQINNTTLNKILNLSLKCPNDLCNWSGKVHEVETHFKFCQYLQINCPLNCNQSIIRMNLEKHMNIDCPERSINCQYCDKIIKDKMLIKHIEHECLKYPIECPYHCSDGQFVFNREILNGHLKICRNFPIVCPLHKLELKRCEIEDHFQQNLQEHFISLSNENKSLKTIIEKNNKDHEKMFKEFKNEINDQKYKINQLNDELQKIKNKIGKFDENISQNNEK